MFISDKWQDYQIIDAGNGEKLERWGPVVVARPDPQIIWPCMKPQSTWDTRHMHYHRSKSGGGHWEHIKKTPVQWTMAYGKLTFNIRPTDFKHLGLFPEQATNWEWAADLIKKAKRQIKVLNLFAYTGAATASCLQAGAYVTHIDASKGITKWAKDNINSSEIENKNCRIMVDDVYKFVLREQRRGNYYDGIMMDPPSYGRGPSGEVWKLENRLFDLLCNCTKLLSDRPLFMLLNTYTTGFTATAAENVLKYALSKHRLVGDVTSDTLALPISDSDLLLPCGATVRCRF